MKSLEAFEPSNLGAAKMLSAGKMLRALQMVSRMLWWMSFSSRRYHFFRFLPLRNKLQLRPQVSRRMPHPRNRRGPHAADPRRALRSNPHEMIIATAEVPALGSLLMEREINSARRAQDGLVQIDSDSMHQIF